MLLRVHTATLLRRTALPSIRPFASEAITTTGAVKFFDRKKGFGFIRADDADVNGDVYVNRSVIVGTCEPIINSPSLMKDERVRFEPSIDENGKLVAQNVTKEDGSKFRVYTAEHSVYMKNGLKGRLGVSLYNILDDDELEEEAKLSKVMEEFQATRAQVAEVEAKQAAEEQEENEQKEQQEEERGEM